MRAYGAKIVKIYYVLNIVALGTKDSSYLAQIWRVTNSIRFRFSGPKFNFTILPTRVSKS